LSYPLNRKTHKQKNQTDTNEYIIAFSAIIKRKENKLQLTQLQMELTEALFMPGTAAGFSM